MQYNSTTVQRAMVSEGFDGVGEGCDEEFWIVSISIHIIPYLSTIMKRDCRVYVRYRHRSESIESQGNSVCLKRKRTIAHHGRWPRATCVVIAQLGYGTSLFCPPFLLLTIGFQRRSVWSSTDLSLSVGRARQWRYGKHDHTRLPKHVLSLGYARLVSRPFLPTLHL